ncbi:GGDEF domain-containing protein [Paenibacillus hexagrammi]|uniref:GGDEF domain-containing protein n=1 Tax=Paenibacillus hexagrammi TaxID=2908839 RepID=A0ABY3SEU7_9BACL|nr:GGDEF domain-containing protein [Paenibacillus sp. YPD9-1]UJF31764.1 GGDEF domain-containing protein [Paenibacillus sp. YPD9-1]
MKYRGRIITACLILPIHTAYIIYYYIRDGRVDIADLSAYPLFIIIAYWAGLQYDKAVYYSNMDALTNLYNRRFIISAFGKIKSQVQRVKSRMFLLLIDCDKFKEINDTYGHAKGDAVLASIAKTLTASTRPRDLIARWGGDEFVIIGHYKDEEKVLQVILNLLETQLLEVADKFDFPVTVSIGTAIFPDDGQDLDQLLRIADENMYTCKRVKKTDFHP